MFSLFPAANIITADNGCRGKPHPDIYLTAAQSLGQSQPHLVNLHPSGIELLYRVLADRQVEMSELQNQLQKLN
jgi:beta-phosphoglucomutase-like phosphatase (HAD superfamily)